MKKISFATAALLACLPLTEAIAQQACAPGTVKAAIDAYAQEPYGARAYRKMSGLGDPGIEANSIYFDSWQDRDEWTKLVQQVAPDMADASNISYDCRIGYPLSVLKQRIASFGVADAYVKQWVKAQAEVIKACAAGQGASIALPDAIEVRPEQVDMQRQDRAYQTASIAFYADKPKAIEMFKIIGASNSAHKAAARYNVANLLANARNVAEARKEVQAILADPALSSVHGITEELDGYISNIEDTAAGWTTLIDRTVATLSRPARDIAASEDSKKRFAAALYDIGFVGVGGKQGDWWITNTLPENPTLSKSLADAARSQPMALWLMAGQTVQQHFSQAPVALMGAKWQAWNDSIIDRSLALQPAGAQLPALAKSTLVSLRSAADDATRNALWQSVQAAAQAAQKSCGDANETGALAALAMNAVRLSVMSGHFEEAANGLKTLGLQETDLYRRMLVPELLEAALAAGEVEQGRRARDLLGLDAFVSSLSSEDMAVDRDRLATLLSFLAEDKDRWLAMTKLQSQKLSSPMLNLLPAKSLAALASDEGFSAQQRALLSRAAWTRGYARGLAAKPKDTAAMLALNPQLQQALDKVKSDYPKLRDKDAWLLTILRNPRFGILVNSADWTDPIEADRENFAAIDSYDHNDKNWWCPLETDRQLGAIRSSFDNATGTFVAREYYSDTLKPLLDDGALEAVAAKRDAVLKQHPMVKAVDWKEVGKLTSAPQAPKALSLAAIALAKSGRAPDAAAEALARAVTVTRYGCNWHGGHGSYSKQAQTLLKQKFPQSTWAAQTPYWFDCTVNRWDDQGNKIAECKPREWAKQAPLR